MCLIILKPNADVTFNPDYMKSSVTRNNDGAGCMYVQDGRLVVEKIDGDYSKHTSIDSITEWCNQKFTEHDAIAIHHRMTTDGSNHLDNIHPYKVLSIDDGDPVDLYMMHNGIIHNSRPPATTKVVGTKQVYNSWEDYLYDREDSSILDATLVQPSDTSIFISDIVQPILKQDYTLLYTKAMQKLLEEYIGTGSKLLFMDNTGTITLINENAGTWLDNDGGCWLSNTYSHKSHGTTGNYYGTWWTHNNTPVKSPVKSGDKKDTTTTVNKSTNAFEDTKSDDVGTIVSLKTSTPDSNSVVKYTPTKNSVKEFWDDTTSEELADYLCMSSSFDDITYVVEQAPEQAIDLIEFLLDFYFQNMLTQEPYKAAGRG